MTEQEDTPTPTGPDPDAVARAKVERLEREKEQLLHDVAAAITDDLRAQVGYVLNHYPEARDSDVRLAHLVWETFYPEYIEGEWVGLEDMFHLPRQTTITRTRAKIQNEYGLFQASHEVAGYRRTLRDETKTTVVADKPGPPILSVFADESGKTQRFLVVGSVWGVDVGRMWRVVQALRAWKREARITGEFKFADITKGKLAATRDFVKAAMEHSALIGLKACVLDTWTVKGTSKEDVLYRLYYELAMTGMEHEVAAGRVVLPRWLHLVKDADDGADGLLLSELERRLKTGCREHFEDQVQVESVSTALSHETPLLELADLFSGSVARRFNKDTGGTNQKDEFAEFFETVAGFDFVATGKSASDFVYVRQLGAIKPLAEPAPAVLAEVTEPEPGLLELPGF